jgi:FAD:protein FMN transferase
LAGYDRDFGEIRDGVPTFDGPGRGVVPASAPPGSAGPAGPAGPASPVPGWHAVQLDPDKPAVRLTRGAQLDLGSTAKAWAADHCASLINAKLGCGVLVSLGGDVAVAGRQPGDGWQIRVTDDHAAPADAPGQRVTISSGGLATSSTTVRCWSAGSATMHHIIDPRTGQPARSCWRTVSVAAQTCADANIASTAAIVRSEAALPWLTEATLPARLLRHDGTVATTPGAPADHPDPQHPQYPNIPISSKYP